MEYKVEFYISETRKCPVTNFDRYLEEQLKNNEFAERFRCAGEAWDVALKLASLRKKAKITQKELAQKLKTSQQQISRLESPSYEGHSLSMLRRVARVLNAEIRVEFRPASPKKDKIVAESRAGYSKHRSQRY